MNGIACFELGGSCVREPTGNSSKALGGTGASVVGVYPRKATILDAVGLMLRKDWDRRGAWRK